MDKTFDAEGSRTGFSDKAFGQILYDERQTIKTLKEILELNDFELHQFPRSAKHVELTPEGPVVDQVNIDDKSVLDVAESIDNLSPAEKAAIEAWPVLSETTVCIDPDVPGSKGQVVLIKCTDKDVTDLSPKEKHDYLESKQIHLMDTDTFVKLDEDNYLIIPELPQLR